MTYLQSSDGSLSLCYESLPSVHQIRLPAATSGPISRREVAGNLEFGRNIAPLHMLLT